MLNFVRADSDPRLAVVWLLGCNFTKGLSSKGNTTHKECTVHVVREMDDGHCIMGLPDFFPAADSTGTHSLYTAYKDYELMFHVSTLLPYTPNNKQQVRTDSPAF